MVSKGDAVQSSQWMDGCRSKQSQSVGSEQGTALIIRRWITISNSLGQISNPRQIGSISPMIGQTSRSQYASKKTPQVKSTTHHITKHKHMSIKKKTANGIMITTKKCYFVDLIIMVLSTFE